VLCTTPKNKRIKGKAERRNDGMCAVAKENGSTSAVDECDGVLGAQSNEKMSAV